MRCMLIILVLFCALDISHAQVSGRVTKVNGQPIAFANVQLLYAADSTNLKTAITDENGRYRLEKIPAGQYIIRINSVAYSTYITSFETSSGQENKDLGTQVLTESVQQLETVVVKAQKALYQQTTTGTIVNVESSILSKGSSALEVLQRSPGILIDYRNGGITLNGKSGVLIMIDGRILRMSSAQIIDFLNSMSANDIEKIELLSMPPAGYDAEGNAGIINIVLKKNKNYGTSGSVNVTAGYGWAQKATAGINLAHNTKKINLYGTYTFSRDKTYSDLDIVSYQNMQLFGGQLDVRLHDTTKASLSNHAATAGIEYKITPHTTVGANITYNSSHDLRTTYSHSTYRLMPDSILFFDGTNAGTDRWKNMLASVYAEKQLGSGEKLLFDADYLHFNNNGPAVISSSFVTKEGAVVNNNDSLFSPSQRTFANTSINVIVGKMDYTRQLSKRIKLEAGFKGTFTNVSSHSGIESLVNGEWVNRSESASGILMKEGIGAAYASANVELSTATNLVAGLRYEYSSTYMSEPDTKQHVIERKSGMLFPNISVTHKLKNKSELQLSYTKRITRPTYNDLASYVGYSDPTAVYTGNLFLKPTITHNLKLGYSFRSYAFSVLLSRDVNPIARYQLTESPSGDILFVSPQNLLWQNNMSFQATIPLKVNNWWNMSYTYTGGPRMFKLDYTKRPVEKTYFGFSFNFTQSFKLPRSFSFELSGWYNGSSYNGSVKMGGFGALNAGVKKELKNNWGTLQLAASDLLRSVHIHSYYGALTDEAFHITNHVIYNPESTRFPIVKLTYSKSFGRAAGKKEKQNNGSSDESERIRKE
ncbi:TonB-dependent receptor [Danxiaibacter flavus]|uniref:TonB-dependent receptor n=1 Tax=Danxiaibacter flavus TaxID=3049108 RepID=A0ABV3ZES3_9BACT|nr:TonB-dependent receptor [Chitinophagaceae bacterium DXS]